MRWSFYGWFIIVLLAGDRALAQVNPQNGAAQVSIPLYSYADAGNRLGLNASLVYIDGNGLKVSEVASPVGTGWILDCGGSITRLQHGEPDDQKQYGTFGYHETNAAYENYMNNYYPDGYLNTTFSPSDNIDNLGAYEVYAASLPPEPPTNPASYKLPPKYLADREQDVFAFTFNGRSGQFVIGKNRQVKTLVDSRLKIDIQESDMHTNGIRTTISQFTITDESGIQYVFKDLELSYVCTYNDFRNITTDNQNIAATPTNLYPPGSYLINNAKIVLAMARPTSQYIVSKWYLSQIINPFTNKKITFNYDTYEQDIDGDLLISRVQVSGQTGGETNAIWQKIKNKARRLSSVVLSNAERLDFVYYSGTRIDQATEPALNALNVSYNGNLVYGWKFGLGYFLGNQFLIRDISDTHVYTDEEKHWARLALQTLQKTGPNGAVEPPYRFSYDMGGRPGVTVDYIPPQFSIHKDHFGYYAPWELWTHSEGYATSFYTIDDIRSAGFSEASGNAPVHGPMVDRAGHGIITSITYPMGGTLSFTYENNTTPTMKLGGVRVGSTKQSDGIDPSKDIIRQYKYIMPDGSSSLWGGEVYNYLDSYTLRANNCGGSYATGSQLEQTAMSIIIPMFPGASLFQGMARMGHAPGGAINFIFYALFGDLFSSAGPAYYTVTSTLNLSAVAANPLPWGYARTEVSTLLSTGNTGKTIYEFSSPADRPIDLPTINVANSSRPRYAFWVYGLPKTITLLDKDDNTVKRTINHYNFIVNATPDNNFLSKSWSPNKKAYVCGIFDGPESNSDMIDQETYYPFTGHTELSSTDEITFNSQGQHTTVTTSFDYDAYFQLAHKYFYNSKGEKVETYYYHPYDYCINTGTIPVMNNGSNIISPIVSAETYITKSDIKYLIDATTTDFGFIGSGDIKPRKTYTFQSVQPFPATSFNCSSLVRDPDNIKQIALYDYDNNGNLIQTLSGGNKLTSTIYDYDGKLATVSVANASYNDIGYTSFEAEGGKAGSWVNAAAVVADDARTGSHCFNLSDPSNSTGNYFGFGGLNSSLSYIVSFWAKNSSACIKGYTGVTNSVNTCQGASGWVQGATVNGWTYYEKQVSGVDKIGMSGTGLVDEFRVYPVGAQMTTTTYAPLIGKTSECDVSGRVTYYLYDDLGRLIKVSDDGRNVIRTYEYNYKQ